MLKHPHVVETKQKSASWESTPFVNTYKDYHLSCFHEDFVEPGPQRKLLRTGFVRASTFTLHLGDYKHSVGLLMVLKHGHFMRLRFISEGRGRPKLRGTTAAMSDLSSHQDLVAVSTVGFDKIKELVDELVRVSFQMLDNYESIPELTLPEGFQLYTDE